MGHLTARHDGSLGVLDYLGGRQGCAFGRAACERIHGGGGGGGDDSGRGGGRSSVGKFPTCEEDKGECDVTVRLLLCLEERESEGARESERESGQETRTLYISQKGVQADL